MNNLKLAALCLCATAFFAQGMENKDVGYLLKKNEFQKTIQLNTLLKLRNGLEVVPLFNTDGKVKKNTIADVLSTINNGDYTLLVSTNNFFKKAGKGLVGFVEKNPVVMEMVYKNFDKGLVISGITEEDNQAAKSFKELLDNFTTNAKEQLSIQSALELLQGEIGCNVVVNNAPNMPDLKKITDIYTLRALYRLDNEAIKKEIVRKQNLFK